MLVPTLAAYFKHRAVRSIFILACWQTFEQKKFLHEISKHGLRATFACEPTSLDNIQRYGLQGVVYFKETNNDILLKVKPEHFCSHYVWLVIGDSVPTPLDRVRYDAELLLLQKDDAKNYTGMATDLQLNEPVFLKDIYVHPREGASLYPWAYWSQATGLKILYDRERILRRLNFKGYPLRIAAPVGQYSDDWYNGTYAEYVVDESLTELDGGIRSGYAASALIIELVNATEVLITTELWSTTIHNSSMTLMLRYGRSELGGGILRILLDRLGKLDYIMPIWPFNVGFTYLAERESSSNMFVEPFTSGVWATGAVIALVLALAQRATARATEEKDGAYYAVLATILQQDASAVPKGLSGRWTFTVLSICAMLVHAYYTSAIVSALMSAGSGGPNSLRTLADSKYAIASEDYDYMRYLFFDVETTWEDLEYLKRKKKTSTTRFYHELERGVELIRDGSTAFHSEYNQIYPRIKTFTDDQICKLQHVDTIPKIMTWVTTSPRGQFTGTFRSAGAWLHETGLGQRLVSRLQVRKPPCRAQMLAERVKFGDVAPLIGVTAFGAVLSVILLGVEIMVAKKTKWGITNRLLSVNENTDAAVIDSDVE